MKRLLKVFVLGICMIWGLQHASAQIQYITGPDTVCILQDIFVNSTYPTDTTKKYFYGTCSAYMERNPTGRVIVNGGLNGPTAVALQQDSGKYYMFVTSFNSPFELSRLDFGASISNTPSVVNLGNFGNLIAQRATGIDLFYEAGNWYGFIIGGIGVATNLARLDFGSSLANTPTVTALGNLGGLLVSPQSINFFKEGPNYFAYYFNGFSGNLVRLDFGYSINNVPSVNDLGNPGGLLAFPTSMTMVQQNGSYHGFVLNRLSNTLTRLDFGTSRLNVPATYNLGNLGGLLNNPRYINFIYDNNRYYGFISNEATNQMVQCKFGSNITNIPTANAMPNFAGFNGPRGITQLIREKDNIYGFVANYQTNTISQIHYDTSTNATLLKYNDEKIPVYQYTKPGLYNVYYEVYDSNGVAYNEQHQIQVLAKPKLDLTKDTMICQGDTAFLVANGVRLDSILWSPQYNLKYRYDTTSVYVYPHEDYVYNIHMEFEYGCILDTFIKVKVSKIFADAGPDRIIADGASTELGGPSTSLGVGNYYTWTPTLNLNIDNIPNPMVQPTDSITYYYFRVANNDGCKRFDTVAVRTFCGEVHLPNAFNPSSNITANRTFGIENNQLSKIEYFRVYNRYGQVVFETTNAFARWDGVFNGQAQPQDTYVWLVEGICNNGRKVKRSGNVLLVR
jgi:gliding motility-associated-like protein